MIHTNNNLLILITVSINEAIIRNDNSPSETRFGVVFNSVSEKQKPQETFFKIVLKNDVVNHNKGQQSNEPIIMQSRYTACERIPTALEKHDSKAQLAWILLSKIKGIAKLLLFCPERNIIHRGFGRFVARFHQKCEPLPKC